MEQYYKLKSRYEKTIDKHKTKIINNDSLTIKEKKQRFKLFQPKCVNCANPVGTLFLNNDRVLIAKCGAINNPLFEQCDLDMRIKKSYSQSDSFITYQNQIDRLKIKIMTSRLNLLYNYPDTHNISDLNHKLKQYEEQITMAQKDSEKKTIDISELVQKLDLTDVNIYINDLLPMVKKNRELRFKRSSVIYNEDSGLYFLKQVPVL